MVLARKLAIFQAFYVEQLSLRMVYILSGWEHRYHCWSLCHRCIVRRLYNAKNVYVFAWSLRLSSISNIFQSVFPIDTFHASSQTIQKEHTCADAMPHSCGHKEYLCPAIWHITSWSLVVNRSPWENDFLAQACHLPNLLCLAALAPHV